MDRVPKVGDAFSTEDYFMCLEAMQKLVNKARLGGVAQPNPTEIMGLVLFNIGDRFKTVSCIEGEWESLKGDIPPGEGVPKCPNGHVLYERGGLKLGWVPDGTVVTEQDDDNCPIFYDVDFGEGPVRVRCTKLKGSHKVHTTEVEFR